MKVRTFKELFKVAGIEDTVEARTILISTCLSEETVDFVRDELKWINATGKHDIILNKNQLAMVKIMPWDSTDYLVNIALLNITSWSYNLPELSQELFDFLTNDIKKCELVKIRCEESQDDDECPNSPHTLSEVSTIEEFINYMRLVYVRAKRGEVIHSKGTKNLIDLDLDYPEKKTVVVLDCMQLAYMSLTQVANKYRHNMKMREQKRRIKSLKRKVKSKAIRLCELCEVNKELNLELEQITNQTKEVTRAQSIHQLKLSKDKRDADITRLKESIHELDKKSADIERKRSSLMEEFQALTEFKDSTAEMHEILSNGKSELEDDLYIGGNRLVIFGGIESWSKRIASSCQSIGINYRVIEVSSEVIPDMTSSDVILFNVQGTAPWYYQKIQSIAKENSIKLHVVNCFEIAGIVKHLKLSINTAEG